MSNYEVNRQLPTGKYKRVIRLMKDKLGGKIITEIVALRPKTYSYLVEDDDDDGDDDDDEDNSVKKRQKDQRNV